MSADGQGAGAGGGLRVLRLPVPLQPDVLTVEGHGAVPGRHGQRYGGPGQQIAVDGTGRHLVEQQCVAHLVHEVLGDAVPVRLDVQLIRVVGLRQLAAGRLEQRVGAVAQPEPEAPRLSALLEGDTGQRVQGDGEFAQFLAEQADVLVTPRGEPEGVTVEDPRAVLLDDFRHGADCSRCLRRRAPRRAVLRDSEVPVREGERVVAFTGRRAGSPGCRSAGGRLPGPRDPPSACCCAVAAG